VAFGLVQLAELRALGHLSDAEFARAKERLLASPVKQACS
jgi:hypothetical protein